MPFQKTQNKDIKNLQKMKTLTALLLAATLSIAGCKEKWKTVNLPKETPKLERSKSDNYQLAIIDFEKGSVRFDIYCPSKGMTMTQNGGIRNGPLPPFLKGEDFSVERKYWSDDDFWENWGGSGRVSLIVNGELKSGYEELGRRFWLTFEDNPTIPEKFNQDLEEYYKSRERKLKQMGISEEEFENRVNIICRTEEGNYFLIERPIFSGEGVEKVRYRKLENPPEKKE
jgi:hypothetical protein